MKIRAYVINLDRSPERLEAFRRRADAAHLDFVRVSAVDGKQVPPGERTLLDEAGFLRDHGKHPMAGEYGCYASHVQALNLFLESGDEFALILEDDAALPPDILAFLDEIATRDDWDLVKLTHHRMTHLRPDRLLPGGHALGRATFGPTGSSAAYLIRASAVPRLLKSLLPMRLPYDVALERGWAHGIRVRHVRPDKIKLDAVAESLTQGEASYRKAKLKPWRRLTTLRFRSIDFVRRLIEAGKPGSSTTGSDGVAAANGRSSRSSAR